jgi:hypothetical protein
MVGGVKDQIDLGTPRGFTPHMFLTDSLPLYLNGFSSYGRVWTHESRTRFSMAQPTSRMQITNVHPCDKTLVADVDK